MCQRQRWPSAPPRCASRVSVPYIDIKTSRVQDAGSENLSRGYLKREGTMRSAIQQLFEFAIDYDEILGGIPFAAARSVAPITTQPGEPLGHTLLVYKVAHLLPSSFHLLLAHTLFPPRHHRLPLTETTPQPCRLSVPIPAYTLCPLSMGSIRLGNNWGMIAG
jgi:hypothetical protein